MLPLGGAPFLAASAPDLHGPPINSLTLGTALSLLALDQILSLKFMVLLAASYLGWGCKVGCAPVSFVVLLSMQLKPVY